ncbi:hypothetical protein GOZ93_18920 [Agrobacterium vitis]|uniref:hypothetical protein n=1 Tax=Agrobacterium vitis TaxID=373 RepID=UPI0012E91D6D|nr:hypothetical protein [Agrobacterium vitis]MUZ84292.1 hypothetical protein [Agrobacterium vitis]
MSRAAFKQSDIERIIRAAENQGASIQIDLRRLTATIIPGAADNPAIDAGRDSASKFRRGNLAPDGKDNFDEI